MSALLTQARSGNVQARAQLLGQLQRYLGFVASQQVDPDLQAKMGPSDVVQQSMVRAVENLGQFRGGTVNELRGWLRQILINEARQMKRDLYARKRDVAREIHSFDSCIGDPQNGLTDGMLTPGTNAARQEQVAEIHDALQRIPEQERMIIQWRNWEGLTFGEIARRLNISENTASRKWLKALTVFKEQLKKDGTIHG